MRDPQLATITQSLRHLVPSAGVSYVIRSRRDFRADPQFGDERGRHGQILGDGTAQLWFEVGKNVAIVNLARGGSGFTAFEQEMLNACAGVMAGLTSGLDRIGMTAPNRLAARYAFENLLVHGLLRRDLDPEADWGPVSAVALLQELSFGTHEGAPCRSAFVFTADAARFIEERRRSPYRFEAFDTPLRVDLDFFAQPLSYRFVDGNDALYLIDRRGLVNGVLRSSKPRRWSASERALHLHLAPLLRSETTPTWAVYIGANQEVNVVLPGSAILSWRRMRWRLLDTEHLRRALREVQFERKLIDTLIGVLYRISDTRVGALVLIPHDPRARPRSVGSIDDSQLGASLLGTFQRRYIRTLENSDALIGMLTSDGLTTISRKGRILDAGQIVDLSEDAVRIPDARGKGGGRTQAGRIASIYGLVIKVSEDGPITVFRDGRELITLPR